MGVSLFLLVIERERLSEFPGVGGMNRFGGSRRKEATSRIRWQVWVIPFLLPY